MTDVDIKGLNKADVLLALYNGSHAQGMSMLAVPQSGVSIEMCREAVTSRDGSGEQGSGHNMKPMYFDYWNGHVLKVDIAGDDFDPSLYDRDNYRGAAADAIQKLRESQA